MPEAKPLAYSDSGGTKPALLLLHAFPLSGAMWDGDAQVFAPLARVIAPDLPGFGGSSRQAAPSIAGMARQAAGLLDQLKINEPVIVAGLSMGGYVAFEFIRQFPQQVRALGLFSTRAASDSPQQREGRMRLIEELKAGGIEPLMAKSVPKLVGSTTAQSRPAVLLEVERFVRRASVDGVIDALRAMADREDSRMLLPGIGCPVLIIAGDEDAVIPLQESQAMAEQISGAQLTIIPKAGHLINLEQPEAFQHEVREWLRKS